MVTGDPWGWPEGWPMTAEDAAKDHPKWAVVVSGTAENRIFDLEDELEAARAEIVQLKAALYDATKFAQGSSE